MIKTVDNCLYMYYIDTMRLNNNITKQSKIIVDFAAISIPKASCAFDQRFGYQDCVFGSSDCVAGSNRGTLKQHSEKQPRYDTFSLPERQSKVKIIIWSCYCLLPLGLVQQPQRHSTIQSKSQVTTEYAMLQIVSFKVSQTQSSSKSLRVCLIDLVADLTSIAQTRNVSKLNCCERPTTSRKNTKNNVPSRSVVTVPKCAV